MKKRMKKLLTEVLVISLVIGTGGKSSVYVMADEAIQNTSNGYTGNESTEDQINLDDADQSGVVKSNDKKEMNTVDFDEVSETKSSIKLIEEDISALETKESLDDTESALDENIIDSGTCGVDGIPVRKVGRKMYHDGFEPSKGRLKFRCPLASRKYGRSCKHPFARIPNIPGRSIGYKS